MQVKKIRVLFDCDGIFSDIVPHVLDLIADKTGVRHELSEVTDSLDILGSIGKKHLEKELLEPAVETDKFCLTIPVIEKAVTAFNEIRSFCDVFIVTAPYHQEPWMHHREAWLKKHLGLTKKQIVQTHAKFICHGDVFIDDNIQNVVAWKKEWPSKCGIVFSTQHNKHLAVANDLIVTDNWDKIVKIIRRLSDNNDGSTTNKV